MSETIHPFERAQLGAAPFRCVDMYTSKYCAAPGAPIQPGASCDYCGTGIMLVCVIEGADGRRFKVGSTCVLRTTHKGVRMRTDVDRELRKHKHAREWERIRDAFAAFDAHREVFADQAHPRGFRDRQTGEPLTLADQVEWMRKNAGHAGMLRTARMIEKELAR